MAKRIFFPARGEVDLEEFAPKSPAADEVLVKTRYSLMSIGTETTILHAKYDPQSHFARMFSFPQRKTGVQSIAEVCETGSEVTEFKPGDLIFMRHAHTSHWTLPARLCSAVPAHLDLKQACWCGLAKTAFRAAFAAPFQLGEEVLIVGAGPVGQMALRWATVAGMATVAVADLSAKRLTLAQAGGATHTFEGPLDTIADQLMAATGGKGFATVVDSTGNPQVLPQALGVAAPFGKIILLGDAGHPNRQCLSSDMMTKGLTITATHDHQDRGGWTQRRIDQLFFQHMASGAFRLDGLITHEFRPTDYQEAYALSSDRREDAVGILFDWTAI